ncbi:DEAD/DEAH box helicase [Chromatiaceae bacterium AAb-1]|nr:DEAD/DEAH box helicase [Chromatiaceae bacterium AAb-1]
MKSDISFALSNTQLQRWFDTSTFHRGRAYLQAGRIARLDYNHDLTEVTAQVWGEAFSPYHQFISLRQQQDGWQLVDSCTCPVGGRCKHVLAVLLKLQQAASNQKLALQQQPDHQLSQWFREVEQETADARLKPDKDTVLYLLSYGQAGLQLYPRRTRPSKKGGYTKGQQIGKYDLVSTVLPYWLAEDDFRLLNFFRSQNNKDQSLLENAWGYQLLQQIMATGRCFFGESRYPVSWGPDRPLHLSWQATPAGQQLHWQPDDDTELELVYTTPPCYLDTTHYQLGLLQTSLSGQQLKQLTKMPVIPQTLLTSSIQKLQSLFPDTELPLPTAAGIYHLDVQPTPVLQLQMQPAPDGRKMPVALLSMLYGPHHLPLNLQQHQVVIEQQDNTVFIKRRRQTEAAALETLTSLGLVMQPTSATTPVFDTGEGPDNPQLWQPVLDALPELTSAGWKIEKAGDFNLDILQAKPYLQVQDGKPGRFELSIQADIDGQQVPLLPLISQWLRQYGMPSAQQTIWLTLPQGKLALPVALIQPIIDTIIALLNLQKAPHILELADYQAAALPLPEAAEIRYLNAERVKTLASQLQHFAGISPVAAPAGLKAILRDYQQQGLNWLCFLRQYGFGGILADDMGLGKTLQTLSFLLHEKQQGRLTRPALVICPTSLLGNWQQETQRFTPALSLQPLHGTKRQMQFEQAMQHDVVLTTYPLLVRDLKFYQQQTFSAIILDEAQHIKNAGSQAAKGLRTLHSDFRLALSGTPLENHLGELKSLFDFALPGLLGTEQHFLQVYRKPIEKHSDPERANALKKKIAPFILRRTKHQVAAELPDKTEIIQLLELETDQRNLYESVRLIMETKVREMFLRKGVAASQIEYLDALLKLRQVCCDARLLPIEQAQSVKHNSKLTWLRENLPEMVEEGRRILLFSQFASMLSLIEQELLFMDIPYSKLTGQTKKRQQQIDNFQQGNTHVFLISLKAGGTGLNLTAADTVIHYDPWWNPAAEQQATDRAHRIGQDKAVFVYKLITRNTVEERVQQLQQAKQGLADQLFAGGKGQTWQGSAQELLRLFAEN